MNTWAERVKSRMKELKMTQEVLANKMGITRGAITHYLAGRRVPPLRQFQKLAAILKSDPAWLQFGTQAIKNAKSISHSKKEENAPIKNPIPLLSWAQAAEFTHASKIKSEITEWAPDFFTEKSNWYALRIQGDTMIAPMGSSKSFHEGDIIVVNPDKKVAHGNYVVAILPRSKTATFKQYVVDGDVHYLKPLNPQYPIIKIDESTHICGVVIGCISLI